MHYFLHGIRRAFLAACGGSRFPCLPALALPKEAENVDLLGVFVRPKEVKKGAIQPTLQGSDNADLQPSHENYKDEGDLLPTSGEDQDEDFAVNLDLHDEGKLLPNANGEIEADLQHKIEEQSNDGEGPLLPSLGDEDEAINSLLSCNKGAQEGCKLHIWYAYAIQINMQDVVLNAWQQHRCILVPSLNAWLMPFSRPRVKMKGNLQQLDIHAWKHDAWMSSSSPSTSSIPIHCTDAKVVQAHQWSSLFTSFRGRNVRQSCAKLKLKIPLEIAKTKTRRMQMRPLYITKDILDPG